MLIKTEVLHLKFLQDLADLIQFKNKYLTALNDHKDPLNIGYQNQLNRSAGSGVAFFGSYFSKQFGKFFTDIDIIQYVNLDFPHFFTRLRDIIKNLDRTNFRYVRMYCGNKKGLEIPWDTIPDKPQGSCDFSLDKVDKMMDNLELKYPEVRQKISPFYDKDTLSMEDLLKMEKILEPINSIVWTQEEIVEGKKTVDGVEYNFETEFRNYPKYRVIKFVYKYGDEYCFIDMNFRSLKTGQIKEGIEDILAFFTNDSYKKFKFVKKFLPDKLQGDEKETPLEQYKKDVASAIGKITPLAGLVESINSLKRYKAIPDDALKKMEEEAKKYSDDNNIRTIDYNEIQKMITERTKGLYEKYRPKIADKFKYIYFIYETRNEEFRTQISKSELYLREKYLKCPFYRVNSEQLEILYNRSVAAMVDPKKLLNCVISVCDQYGEEYNKTVDLMFKNQGKYIVQERDMYTIVKNGNVMMKSTDLKLLQSKLLCN